MRPAEDDEPQSWWIASTAIPLIAATTGPLANVMSIVALVQPWRNDIISKTEERAGTYLQEGYPDPPWWVKTGSCGYSYGELSNAVSRITALNAVSLVCGVVGNIFLLFNFTRAIRYIIALPVTIILWFIATGIVSDASVWLWSPY
jgi:potassium channel subfamily K